MVGAECDAASAEHQSTGPSSSDEQRCVFRSELSYRAMALHLPVLLALGALWIFANERIEFLRNYGFLIPVAIVVTVELFGLVIRIRTR
jgi:hypothetical protein